MKYPSSKAKRVYAALLRIGWDFVRQNGSHKTLTHPDRGHYVFAFHDSRELTHSELKIIGRQTGLKPEDL